MGCIQINEKEFIFIAIIPSREGVCVLSRFSCVRLFATPWTVAQQAPLSVEFSRQEYWSGLPYPPPEDLPDLGIEPRTPAFQADSLLYVPPEKPKNDIMMCIHTKSREGRIYLFVKENF